MTHCGGLVQGIVMNENELIIIITFKWLAIWCHQNDLVAWTKQWYFVCEQLKFWWEWFECQLNIIDC